MISGILKKIFGSRNDRLIKQYSQIVKRINALEPSLQGLCVRPENANWACGISMRN
jgi:preprotein translocase subunit SecA